jgi:hypothetical protein
MQRQTQKELEIHFRIASNMVSGDRDPHSAR